MGYELFTRPWGAEEPAGAREALQNEVPQGQPVTYSPVQPRGEQTLAVNPFWSERVQDEVVLRSLRPQGLPRSSTGLEDVSGGMPDMRQLLATVTAELSFEAGVRRSQGPSTNTEGTKG